MSYIKSFQEIDKSDVAIAGGKGASLGEMTGAGIPVPSGFVLTAQAFDEFLKITDLNVELDAILDNVDHTVMDGEVVADGDNDKPAVYSVNKASEKINALILDADMPVEFAEEITAAFGDLGAKYVAVRSSATSEDSADAAWAGQLESYLNTTEESLLKNVKKCWASLFTPRAIFYRFEKGLHGDPISVAVVVQKMVESEVSGIAFSVHPVTQDRDQMIIEAGLGLGEAIVSGSITPDSYVVEKSARNILDKNITTQEKGMYRGESGGAEWQDIPASEGEKPTLTDERVMELSDLVMKIEKHYGFPVDVEWAIEGGKFYILQSRPITTLSSGSAPSSQEEPFPNAYKSDYWLDHGRWVQRPLSSSFWVGYPNSEIPSRVYPAYKLHAYFHVDSYFWYAKEDQEYILEDLVKQYNAGSLNTVLNAFDEVGNEIVDRYERVFSEDLIATDSLRDLFARHQDLVSFWWLDEMIGGNIMKAALKAGVVRSEADFFELVHPHLRRTWIEKEEASVKEMAEYLVGKEIEDVTEQSLTKLMAEDATFRKQMDSYLEVYSWLGINKWEGEPNSFKKCADRLAEGVQNVVQGNYVEPRNAAAGDFSDLDHLVQMGVVTAYWRPVCGGISAHFEFAMRNRIEKMGAEHSLSYDDCLNLTYFELISLEEDGELKVSREELQARSSGFAQFQLKNKEIAMITAADPEYQQLKELYGQTPKPDDLSVLKGMSARKGVVRARASVVTGQADFANFSEGDILVAPETTPAFVPLMRKATAIVTEGGGITSHAAIVSRELGIPCVISVKGLMAVVKNGDEVEVDADKGVVRVIKRA